MAKSVTKQEFQHRTILQADKLLTTACENRKMLLEYEQELLPFTVRAMLKKQSKERNEIEAYLDQIFESNPQYNEKQSQNPEEVHQQFLQAAEQLMNISSGLNASLTVESDQQ